METKHINSIFEKPQSFIYQLIVGVGSFSVLLFLFIEHGFKLFGIKDAGNMFYIFIILYLGLPAFLPFYHLILSGRNLPRHFIIAVPAIISIVFMIMQLPDPALKWFVPVTIFLIWVSAFIMKTSTDIPLKKKGGLALLIKKNKSVLIISLLSTIIILVWKFLFTDYQWAILLIGLGIWIGYFLLLFSCGVTLKSSDDIKYFIKENAIIEILFFAALLLAGLSIKTYQLCDEKKEELEITKVFENYKKGDTISACLKNGTEYEELITKVNISDTLNKIPTAKYLRTEIESVIKKYNETKDNTLKIKTDTIAHVKNKNLANKVQLALYNDMFADGFVKVLKAYQARGVIILILTALALLFLWVVTIEKEEISNRIKSHFFITLFLIIPLMNDFEKKDISIDNPFGAKSKSNEPAKPNDPLKPGYPPGGGNPPPHDPDTSKRLPKVYVLTPQQLEILLTTLKNDIPLETKKKLIELYNQKEYRAYFRKLADDKDAIINPPKP